MHVLSADSYDGLLYQGLRLLLTEGKAAAPRGKETLEVENVCLELTQPRERVCLLPQRKANIFGTLADTLWVLAGRQDVEFPAYYIKRLREFSDDGLTFHGGYGPRLRNWHGVDQLKAVYGLLTQEPATRRAVLILFDPLRDLTTTGKDIPCNNWMQFTLRQYRLNLRVVSRSMDVVWGSAINVFEWTVLQELMAVSLGVQLGSYTHIVGSFHIYRDYIPLAKDITAQPLQEHAAPSLPIGLAIDQLDSALRQVFALEEGMRTLQTPDLGAVEDPWFREAVRLLWIHSLHKHRRYLEAWETLGEARESGMKWAARDFLLRNKAYATYGGRLHPDG